jgi:hypothetical protein
MPAYKGPKCIVSLRARNCNIFYSIQHRNLGSAKGTTVRQIFALWQNFEICDHKAVASKGRICDKVSEWQDRTHPYRRQLWYRKMDVRVSNTRSTALNFTLVTSLRPSEEALVCLTLLLSQSPQFYAEGILSFITLCEMCLNFQGDYVEK